jgi:uncharacterized membrane protein
MYVRKIAFISIMSSLGVVSRVLLTVIPNVSLVAPISLVAGYLGGGFVGFLVGLLTMVISDIYIGAGPWTIVTSFSMGLVGLFGGLLIRRVKDVYTMFVLSFLSILLYDLLTSIVTMYIFGVPPFIAVINLFTPVFIGFLPYPMGPIHEFSSSIIFLYLIRYLSRYPSIFEVFR